MSISSLAYTNPFLFRSGNWPMVHLLKSKQDLLYFFLVPIFFPSHSFRFWTIRKLVSSVSIVTIESKKGSSKSFLLIQISS